MRFDAHQDYITDVGIRGFGRHAGRGLRAAGGARVDGVVRQLRGALVTADLHQGTTASCEENKLT